MAKRIVMAFVLVVSLLCSGCATLGTGKIVTHFTQQRKLSRAVELIESGNPSQARGLLEEVVAGEGIPGVTDEALFRLALLSIEDEPDGDMTRTIQLLDRLRREYPSSPWTLQGASLTEFFQKHEQKLRKAQEQRLARALEALEEGNMEKATALLSQVATEKGIPGVTDEALFRLALLTIGTEGDQEKIARTSKLLERLQTDYPDSPWTVQAVPLSDLLTGLSRKNQKTQELRRQIKSFKDLNVTLTRENRELRLNLERLKHLDLELERKK